MSGLLAAETTLPAGALVALGVLAAVEIGLAVFCIVDILRRPAVLGGRKWLWIVLVLLFSLAGPIIYLAVGRVPPPAVAETRDEPEAMTRTRAESAADLLYGPAGSPAAEDADEAGPR